MAIKSILTLYNGDAGEANGLVATANLIAPSRGRARVMFFAASQVAQPYSYNAVQGSFAMGAPAVEATLMAAADQEREKAADKVWDAASKVLEDLGIALHRQSSESHDYAEAVVFSASFDDFETALPEESRTVDLVLGSYDHRKNDDLGPILVALFRTGRPVMTIPRLPGGTVGKDWPQNIVVGWDGSVSSARALREAIPLMENARQVKIVTIFGKRQEVNESEGQAILAYLQLHDITAEFEHVVRSNGSTGACLLTRTQEVGADLLVMGAYGHGHLAEMILGGTTSHILKHTHVPLFLVH